MERELVLEWADWLGVVLASVLVLALGLVLDSLLALACYMDTDVPQNRVAVCCNMVEKRSNSFALVVVRLVQV
jgi:hypothetical protein